MTTQNKAQPTFQVLRQHPLDLALRDFLLDCEAANRAPKTIRIYRETLSQFLSFAKAYNAETIEPTHIRAFLSELAKTHNPGGVHGYYRVIKTFVRFMVREDMIDRNPIERVRPPKVDQEPLEPVSQDVLEGMLATCDRSEIGLRDRALLMLLIDSGVRAGEAVALSIADIDLTDGGVLVRKSKSRKPRTTFVGRQTRRAIAAYLRARAEVEPNDPLWLAYRLDGERERLTYWGLRSMVIRRAKAAGVKLPSLHSFRRAFAIMSLRNGADPVSLSRMMGHGSLPVILRYLKQQASDLAQVHQATSPIDRLKR